MAVQVAVLVFPFILVISSEETLQSLGVVGHQAVSELHSHSGPSLLFPPLPGSWGTALFKCLNSLFCQIKDSYKTFLQNFFFRARSLVSVVVFRQVAVQYSSRALAATSRATDFYSINAPARRQPLQRRFNNHGKVLSQLTYHFHCHYSAQGGKIELYL